MKPAQPLVGVATLLLTSGCLVAEDGHRGYHRHEGRAAVVVREPVVVVRPPEVIIR